MFMVKFETSQSQNAEHYIYRKPYNKHAHKRTCDFLLKADAFLIYRMRGEKATRRDF